MLQTSPIVIKYGGSLLEDPDHRKAFLADVAALHQKEKVVLVHGGGKEISRALDEKGLKPQFVKGLRVTDGPTMEIVEQVLARLNGEIVKQLSDVGVRTEGYSGKTDHLVRATQLPEWGRVGKPAQVDIPVFGRILAKRTLPVFYSVGEDQDGKSLNLNADDFALALALACRASRLVFITDAGGVLDAEGHTISRLDRQRVQELIQKNVISGGMIVKAEASIDAVEKGVGSVDITKNIKYLLNPSDATGAATCFLAQSTTQ